MNNITGVTDFSEIIAEFDGGKKFPPNGRYAPKHFFRGLMVGPSGCGKTSALLSMILASDPDIKVGFDKLYIYAKDIHEPAYEMLKAVLKRVEDEMRQMEQKEPDWKLFVFSDSLSEVPSVDKLNKKLRNLIIFDDWATDSEKEQNIISQHYKMGRKHHASYLYLSQGYTEIPKFIRKQGTHLFIWRLKTARDANFVLQEHNPGFEPEVMLQMYKAATEKDYSFMIIDKVDKSRPVRMGFKCFPKFSGTEQSDEESSDGDDEESS